LDLMNPVQPLTLRKRVCNKALSQFILLAALCLIFTTSTRARAEDIALPLPPDDRQIIDKQLGVGVIGGAVPSKPMDDPSLLFPFHHASVTYRFTSGRNTGKSQTLALTKLPRPGGKFVWRLQLAPSLVGFLHQTPDGDIVMPAVADIGEDAIVVTTPANPFLTKNMKPGETRSYSQEVSVRYLDDISDERYSGKLKSDYTYMGTFQVTVPAGTFEAVLLRTKVEGRIGPAHTRAASYCFFAPGVGLVAMILQQKVTAFWIYNIDGAGGKVLVSR
jgi:hypothetical protein